jgi:hypothetical protein
MRGLGWGPLKMAYTERGMVGLTVLSEAISPVVELLTFSSVRVKTVRK